MPDPLHLTAEEMDILFKLAAPIAREARQQFLRTVADSLAASGQRGPGAVYRAGREAQGPFVTDLRAETSIATTPRHLEPRTSER